MGLRRVDLRTERFSLGGWRGLCHEILAGGQTYVFSWLVERRRLTLYFFLVNERRTASSVAIVAITFTHLHCTVHTLCVEYDTYLLSYQILLFSSSKRM